MPRPIFQSSAETRLITQELAKCAKGEIIPYERICEVVSRPLDDIRGNIATAMRRVLRDKDFVFSAVRGVGLKRLTDAEIVADGSARTTALHKSAARAVERQSKADFDSLTNEQKIRFSAEMSVNSAIAMMTRESSIKKVEAKVPPAARELPTNDTLSMFISK
ncbi:hypothetical protein KL86PLE_100265 [uncultured Pleomorphomonas sp.]|uniref:Uncharacterized protein n=1 Tax=uncultured Pleomorphomonas sp. TaxID=442121 RepID=A0A212L1X1_9HYPH|nr:hypothetical protein [uncultured Pleomorphomonas sp.]SCM71564.1 hypothetical protein KL86PLE_100265 [uncultured Pleomorphomonas sp.]